MSKGNKQRISATLYDYELVSCEIYMPMCQLVLLKTHRVMENMFHVGY